MNIYLSIPSDERKKVWDALIDYFCLYEGAHASIEIAPINALIFEDDSDLTIDYVIQNNPYRSEEPIIESRVQAMLDIYHQLNQARSQEVYQNPDVQEWVDGISHYVPVNKNTADLLKKLTFVSGDYCVSWFEDFAILMPQKDGGLSTLFISGGGDPHEFSSFMFEGRGREKARFINYLVPDFMPETVLNLRDISGIQEYYFHFRYDDSLMTTVGEYLNATAVKALKTACIDYYLSFAQYFSWHIWIPSKLGLKDVDDLRTFIDTNVNDVHIYEKNGGRLLSYTEYKDIFSYATSIEIPPYHTSLNNSLVGRKQVSSLQIKHPQKPDPAKSIRVVIHGTINDEIRRLVYASLEDAPDVLAISIHNGERHTSLTTGRNYRAFLEKSAVDEYEKIINTIYPAENLRVN